MGVPRDIDEALRRAEASYFSIEIAITECDEIDLGEEEHLQLAKAFLVKAHEHFNDYIHETKVLYGKA